MPVAERQMIDKLQKLRKGDIFGRIRAWHFASDTEGKIAAVSLEHLEYDEMYVIWLGKTVTSNGRLDIPKGTPGMVIGLHEPISQGEIITVAEVMFEGRPNPSDIGFKDIEPFQVEVH